MCNDRQESMEGLLPPSNSWGCGGGHGASGLAIVRPSSSGPLALFQICICIFLRCALLIRRRVAARRRPFPESPEVVPSPPRSPPAAGWTTMPSTSPRESESRHLQTPRFQCRAGMDVAVHFAIPRANPEVFEESSGQAREVREGRPLASPAPGPAARFQLCSALSLARRQPALLAGSSLQPVFGWPPASSFDQDSRGSRRLDFRKPSANKASDRLSVVDVLRGFSGTDTITKG